MVTVEQVWDALQEIPDPELPVISLVELGVIKNVAVEGTRVHVELTPTFLGCPALETMQRELRERIAALGADPDVRVALDDSWSTDRISAAGRDKLREAGVAPPTPRTSRPLTLLQLERGPYPCPTCGSTDTRLDNIFGPTPCRSIRYCDSCSQPFEQLKTI